MESRLLVGMLDVLILEVISGGPTYGYAISESVADRSRGSLEIKEGSLYPALHRLERAKYLSAFWKDAEGRSRKYYRITPAGAKHLAARKREWAAFSAGVNGVLDPAHAQG
jgi:transcriptional regulator